jgi:hypothetical protein
LKANVPTGVTTVSEPGCEKGRPLVTYTVPLIDVGEVHVPPPSRSTTA